MQKNIPEAILGDGLPKVFDTMFGGEIIGTLFFLLVLFAALTSSISLMETIVSIICDKLKWNRKITCGIVFLGTIAVGLLSCFGYNIWADVKIIGMQFLDLFDFVSNSVLMPIVAFMTCIFIGFVIKPKAIAEEIEISGKFKREKIFNVVIKYIAPIFIILILVSSVLDVLGIMPI